MNELQFVAEWHWRLVVKAARAKGTCRYYCLPTCW